jgi:hypothetical protein
MRLVSLQLFVVGLYRPPVFEKKVLPPQIIISLPVQIAV